MNKQAERTRPCHAQQARAGLQTVDVDAPSPLPLFALGTRLANWDVSGVELARPCAGPGLVAPSRRPHRAARSLGPVSGPPAQAPCTRLPALPETMGGPPREERRAPPEPSLSLLAPEAARGLSCSGVWCLVRSGNTQDARPAAVEAALICVQGQSSPSLPPRNE